jgi:hypothetical protein
VPESSSVRCLRWTTVGGVRSEVERGGVGERVGGYIISSSALNSIFSFHQVRSLVLDDL